MNEIILISISLLLIGFITVMRMVYSGVIYQKGDYPVRRMKSALNKKSWHKEKRL